MGDSAYYGMVSGGKAIEATVTITGRKTAVTVTVSSLNCDTGTPLGPSQPPTQPPGGATPAPESTRRPVAVTG